MNVVRTSALLAMLGSCKAERHPLPTTLEDGFQVLCERKIECITAIKNTDRATKRCVTARTSSAADGTAEAREGLRVMVVEQAKQCLALPCEQFDACEQRVFDEHLAKLPK
ncbi:MAG TPA: hypothetical protein VFQ65_10590 [Kofleriaceae bacterium]|nr:hypothetical protein [Kofleriaceae bacterium]